jgi:chemotaxis regulatin CheY-phosphate phosphatase CheZ
MRDIMEVSDDEKVINQLDEVTQDSEQKAKEVLEQLEALSKNLTTIQKKSKNLETKLSKSDLDDKSNYIKLIKEIENISNSASDEALSIVTNMQYQDLHRQKIERVINTIRALTRYINNLFESNISDQDRVSSASYIKGDKDKRDVVSNEEIEQLLSIV